MGLKQGISIPINAYITGYEKSLAELKKGMANVDVSKGFGAHLSKELENIEKKVNTISANPIRVVTSEGQVNKLFTDLNNVNQQIIDLGSEMQKLQIPNLDLNKLSAQLSPIEAEIKTLEATLNHLQSPTGFEQLIAKSPVLHRALEQIGLDMKNLTAQDAELAITKKLEEAKKESDAAVESLKRLQSRQLQLQNTVGNKDKVDHVHATMQNIKNEQDVMAQQQREIAIRNALGTVKFGNLKGAVAKQYSKENLDALARELSGLDNPEAVAERIRQLQEETLKEAFEGQGPDIKKGQTLHKIDLDQLAEMLWGINIQNIKEAASRIHDVALTELDIDSIRGKNGQLSERAHNLMNTDKYSAGNKENWELANRALTQSEKNIDNQIQNRNVEINTNQTKIDAANKAMVHASTTSKIYTNLLSDLKKKVAQQQQEIQKLQTQINSKIASQENVARGSLNESKGAANEAIITAKQHYNEAVKAAAQYKTEVSRVQDAEKMVGNIGNFVQRWFSVYTVVRMVRQAIHSVINTVKELDKTITNISIVTNMSSSDLWGQMEKYTATAREFAVSISGVYEVSQLYYQQGLKTAEVMQLTEATLKMARIAGMDYKDATNYMTNAVRSFKMEMEDASHVTDVYSALAAKSATSVSELAQAMSKTASSAEAVGSSFENTTAMIAVMVEATREAPENIGSALKSIISRYGELKTNPAALVDSEGEELSLNKVDTALKTVGITIKDTNGQFRDFDDVIMELASKWDTIDKNTQRYIATIMAGNRQQSRFLALVSSYDRLKTLSAEAADAEDASQLQYLKTLDSIEAKTAQLQTSLQSLYTSSGIEVFYKNILDLSTRIIDNFTKMPKIFNLPIPAIAKIGLAFTSLARIVTTIFGVISHTLRSQAKLITAEEEMQSARRKEINNDEYNHKIANSNAYVGRHRANEATITSDELTAANTRKGINNGTTGATKIQNTRTGAMISLGLSAAGLGASALADNIQSKQDGSAQAITKYATGALGSGLQMAGLGFSVLGLKGAIIGGIIGVITSLFANIGLVVETAEEKAARLAEEAKELSNKALEDKTSYKTADKLITKLRELESTRYDSAEAAEEYQSTVDELVNQFPEMSRGFDAAGNALTDLTSAEETLAKMRKQAADSAYEAAKKELEASEAQMAKISFEQLPTMEGYEPTVVSQYEELSESQQLPQLKKEQKTLTSVIDNVLNYLDTYVANDEVSEEQIQDVVDNLSGINNLDAEDRKRTLNNLVDTWKEDVNNPLYNMLVQLFSSEDYTSLEQELTSLYNIIQDVSQYGTIEWRDAVNQFNELLTQNQNNPALNPWREFWKKIYPNIEKVFEQQKIIDANQAAFYNGEQNRIINQLNQDWIATKNYYERSSGSVQAVSAHFIEKKANWKPAEHPDQTFKQYQEEVTQAYYNWYNDLSDDQEEMLNRIFSDTTNYDYDDLEYALGEMGITIDDTIEKVLKDRYTSSQKIIKQRITDRFMLKGQSNLLSKFDVNNKQITKAEEELLYTLADNVERIGDEAAKTIWNQIQELSPEQRKVAIASIKTNGIDSISGIFDLLKDIENNGLGYKGDKGLYDSVHDLIEHVVVNLPRELNNYTTSLSKNVETMEKAISSATKGMSLDEATKLAAQLGISLNELQFREGKFFLDNYNLIEQQYLSEFNEYQKMLATARDNTIDALTTIYNYNNPAGKYLMDQTEKYLSQIKELNSQIKDLQLQGDQASTNEELTRLQKEQKNLTDTYNIFVSQQETYTENINKLMRGQIESYEEVQKLFQEDIYKDFFISNGIDYNDYLQAMDAWYNRPTEELNKPFMEWLKQYYNGLYQSAVDIGNKYTQYQINSNYINHGDIDSFVNNIFKNNDQKLNELFGENANGMKTALKRSLEANIRAAMNGKISWDQIYKMGDEDYSEELSQFFGDYINGLIKASTNLGSKIVGEFTKAFGSKSTYYTTNEMEKEILDVLAGANRKYIKSSDGIYNIILENEDQIREFIDDVTAGHYNLSWKDQIKTIEDARKELYDMSGYGTLSNIMKNNTVSYFDMMNFIKSINPNLTLQQAEQQVAGFGYEWSEALNAYIVNVKTINEAVNHYNKLAAQEYNKGNHLLGRLYARQAQTLKNYTENNQRKALEDVIKNSQNVTEDQMWKFAEEFDIGMTEMQQIFTRAFDGSIQVNYGALKTTVEQKTTELGNVLETGIFTFIDNYTTDMTSAVSYIMKGTTKFSDMDKFVTKLKQMNPNSKYNVFTAFSWDKDLKTFALSTGALMDYMAAYRSQLIKEYGIQGEDLNQLDNYLGQQMMSEVLDISSFINFSGGGDKKNRAQLQKRLEKLKELNGIETNADLNSILDIIGAGGEAAVTLVQQLAELTGDTLSDDEIKNIATNYVNKISETMDSIQSFEQGAFVGTNELVNNLLKKAGYDIDDNGFIKSTGDVAQAYKIFYDEIKNSNNASLEQINKAYLNIINYTNKGQTLAIESLSNGASMTYEALNNMLTQMGMSLEAVAKDLKAFGLKDIGAGKLRIIDWNTYARKMNLDFNSEEYASAFSTYTQSMIELNRQTETNILEQFRNAMQAGAKNEINLGYMIAKYGEDFIKDTLLKDLTDDKGKNLYTFSNGILKFVDNAGDAIQKFNINLYKFAANLGKFTNEELAELRDDFKQKFVTGLADGIKKAITGSISNKELSQLIEVASMRGIQLDLNDFKETATGLKMSNEAAFQLYVQLSRIDAIAAQLVFDELNKSLQETNDHYKSIASIMERIRQLQIKIKEIGNETDDARLQQYNAELQVAQEILKVRSTTEDSSFNFMQNDLSSAFQNPLNAQKSLIEAYKVFGTAWKQSTKYYDMTAGKWKKSKGMMGFEDFSNWASMMNQMAGIAGNEIEVAGVKLNGSMSAAAELIGKGFSAMEVLEDGSSVINLGNIGLDFKTGVDQMTQNFGEGFDELADQQIEMLDQMIAFAETLVAMEKLGEVAGKDQVIEWGDFQITGVQDRWKAFQNFINEQTKDNEALKKGLQSFKIKDKTLAEIIQKDAQQITEEEAAAINALYQAAKSGDFSNENIWANLKQQLSDAGFIGEFEYEIDGVNVKIGFGENGIILEADENGEYIVGGQNFSNFADAERAALLTQIDKEGGGKNVEIKHMGPTGNIVGKYTLGNRKITVLIDKDKNIKYISSMGKSFDSLNDYITNEITNWKNNPNKYEQKERSKYTDEEIKIILRYTVVPVLNDTNVNDIKLSTAQKRNLAGKTFQEIQDEWNEASEAERITFQAKYGFQLDENGNITDDLLQQLLAQNGIEEKNVHVNVTTNDKGNLTLIDTILNADGKEVTITIGINKDALKGYEWLFENTEETPKPSPITVGENYAAFGLNDSDESPKEGDTETKQNRKSVKVRLGAVELEFSDDDVKINNESARGYVFTLDGTQVAESDIKPGAIYLKYDESNPGKVKLYKAGSEGATELATITANDFITAAENKQVELENGYYLTYDGTNTSYALKDSNGTQIITFTGVPATEVKPGAASYEGDSIPYGGDPNKQYKLVWEDESGQHEVTFTSVAVDGALSGVNPVPDVGENFKLLYNGETGNFDLYKGEAKVGEFTTAQIAAVFGGVANDITPDDIVIFYDESNGKYHLYYKNTNQEWSQITFKKGEGPQLSTSGLRFVIDKDKIKIFYNPATGSYEFGVLNEKGTWTKVTLSDEDLAGHGITIDPNSKKITVTANNGNIKIEYNPAGGGSYSYSKKDSEGGWTTIDLPEHPSGLTITPEGEIAVTIGNGSIRIVYTPDTNQFQYYKKIGKGKGSKWEKLDLDGADVSVTPEGKLEITIGNGDIKLTYDPKKDTIQINEGEPIPLSDAAGNININALTAFLKAGVPVDVISNIFDLFGLGKTPIYLGEGAGTITISQLLPQVAQILKDGGYPDEFIADALTQLQSILKTDPMLRGEDNPLTADVLIGTILPGLTQALNNKGWNLSSLDQLLLGNALGLGVAKTIKDDAKGSVYFNTVLAKLAEGTGMTTDELLEQLGLDKKGEYTLPEKYTVVVEYIKEWKQVGEEGKPEDVEVEADETDSGNTGGTNPKKFLIEGQQPSTSIYNDDNHTDRVDVDQWRKEWAEEAAKAAEAGAGGETKKGPPGIDNDTESLPQWLQLRYQAEQATNLEEAKQLYLQAAQSAIDSGELNEAIEIYNLLSSEKYGQEVYTLAEARKGYVYGLKGRQQLNEGNVQGAINNFRYSLDWDSLLVSLIESGQLSDNDRGLSGIKEYFGELLSDKSPLYEYFKDLNVDWSSADVWDRVLNIVQTGSADAKKILPQFIIKLLGLDENIDFTNLQFNSTNSPSEDDYIQAAAEVVAMRKKYKEGTHRRAEVKEKDELASGASQLLQDMLNTLFIEDIPPIAIEQMQKILEMQETGVDQQQLNDAIDEWIQQFEDELGIYFSLEDLPRNFIQLLIDHYKRTIWQGGQGAENPPDRQQLYEEELIRRGEGIDEETRSLIDNYFDTLEKNKIQDWFNIPLDINTATEEEIAAYNTLYKNFIEKDDTIFTILSEGLESDSKEVQQASRALLTALWSLIEDLRATKIPKTGEGEGKAKGTAAAKGTLMGELGPELYVSGGQYHIAGQNGAEFVNLPSDAIVFNHLQTKRLLTSGFTGRGKPVTNEETAVAFARGNVGPAKASAGDILGTLRSLKDFWTRLKQLNASGLSALGGSGGGGGGGQNSFLKDIERWFNLLQEIARLEKEISYEEKLRSKLQSEMVTNGNAIYESQRRSLQALNEQISKNRELASLQQQRYDERRQELAQQAMFGQLFYYNENGQLNYRTNQINAGKYGTFASATEFLVELGSANSAGKPKYTAQEQYEMLVKAFGKSVVEEATAYTTSGEKTKNASERVQAFFERANGWQEEMTSLWESIQTTQEETLSEEQTRNEILKSINENQISVENKVLEAIENRAQEEIDRAQKERDAFSKAAEAFVKGLSDQLEKEKKLYESQQKSTELNKLRRQLAILQRSGGSASQIRQLQDQINSNTQDMYFEAQQQQIDAIKEASDLQLERLDKQIELMTETLQYQKENGLLWTEVYQVMSWAPGDIEEFISRYTPAFRSQSELEIANSLNEIKSMVEQWVGYRENPVSNPSTTNTHPTLEQMYEQWKQYFATAEQKFGAENIADENLRRQAMEAYYNTYEQTGDWRQAAFAANRVFDPTGELENNQLTPQQQYQQYQQQSSTSTRRYASMTEWGESQVMSSFIGYLMHHYGYNWLKAYQTWNAIPKETRKKWGGWYSDPGKADTLRNAWMNYARSVLGPSNVTPLESPAPGTNTTTTPATPVSNDTANALAFADAAKGMDISRNLVSAALTSGPNYSTLLSLWEESKNLIGKAAAAPITNIVNINNPVVRDMDDVQVIKDTLEQQLLDIAKKTGAYMSVS